MTPQISSDGFVLLDIEAESSELADPSVTTTADSSTVPRIPDVLSRTTNSQVLVRAGSTFVLGGILQDNLDRRESGIPYLRHAPGIGWLFKGKVDRRTKDELFDLSHSENRCRSVDCGFPVGSPIVEGPCT